MTFVKVPAPRSTITDTTSGLEIIVPARRNYFQLAFLAAWLVGWGFGFVSVFRLLALPTDRGGANLFLLVWLVGWTIGGGLCAVIVAWSLAGRERILVGPSTLAITHEIMGIGRKREYANREIRNLRVAPQPYSPFDLRSGLQLWGLGGGVVAFDYGAATVRFAAVQEGEGEMIVRRLKAARVFPGGDSGQTSGM